MARAINKVYVVQPDIGLIEGDLSTEEGCNQLAKIVYQHVVQYASCKEEEDGDVSLRMTTFPPKHQSNFLQSFLAIKDETESTPPASSSSSSNNKISMDPKHFTHFLSIVEVYQYKGRGWLNNEVINKNMYMVGIVPGSKSEDILDYNNSIEDIGNRNSDEIQVGRAYYKLKEAVEMYGGRSGSAGEKNKLHSDLYGGDVIALDCGSAPGGWTKFAIEHFQCKKVYSVDPGQLAPSVLKMEETEHVQMKIQDAIPSLVKDNVKIKLWVSDMCLHNMSSQIDFLLMAKENGLLADNALFVLTLKCVVGKSKTAFDAQAEQTVDTLKDTANVNGVEIMHLFSNRSGERMVMGYIK